MSSPSWSPDAFEAAGSGSSLIGRRIGRFRITGRLGQGGIASVWKASDELLGRTVALKILDAAIGESPDARRRFLQEARKTALLDHPGVVTVYDYGESGGVAFIALSLIDGETVSERAARRLMPIPEAVSVVIHAAEALGHAHERGVVHRDVTGRNIMIAHDGRVIVLDFGLALADGVSRLTSSRSAMGTAPYMAPEAFLGEEQTAASDVYGLAVVLYEALTGALPFAGGAIEAVQYAALNLPPRPLRDRRPDVPPALEQVVLRALSRDREERPATAAVLAAELRALRLDAALPAHLSGEHEPGPSEHVTDRSAAPVRSPSGIPSPLFLLLPRFEWPELGSGAAPSLPTMARHLAEVLAAGLTRRGGLRVLTADRGLGADAADATALAHETGANAVLRGTLTRAESSLRLVYTVLDPWRLEPLAGDVVDGSLLEPFEFEDQVVDSVARSLGLTSRPVLDLDPVPRSDPAAGERYVQALRYLRRHDDEAAVDHAIDLLQRLIVGEPERPPVLAAFVRACLFKYQLTRIRAWESRAARACERAVALAPEAGEVILAMADLNASVGRGEDAIAGYRQALERMPDSPEALLGLAQALVGGGAVDEALATCRQLTQVHPEDWRGYSRLGRILFDRGRYEEALEPWRQVVQLSPDNARGHRNLGSAYYHLDQLDRAVKAYERSLGIQPNATAYSNLGTVLYYLGRASDAVVAFEKSAALTPAEPLVWGNLGNACRWIPGMEERMTVALDRAIALARERLGRNPRDAFLLARMAGWLSNLERHAEAVETARLALALAPDDVECMVRAANVDHQAGRRDEALRGFRAAIARGYGTEELRRDPGLRGFREDPEFQALIEGRTDRRGIDGIS